MTVVNPVFPMSTLDVKDASWSVKLNIEQISLAKVFYAHLEKALKEHFCDAEISSIREAFKCKFNATNLCKMGEKRKNLFVLYGFEGSMLEWRWEDKQ
jgi:hypothetical protein